MSFKDFHLLILRICGAAVTLVTYAAIGYTFLLMAQQSGCTP